MDDDPADVPLDNPEPPPITAPVEEIEMYIAGRYRRKMRQWQSAIWRDIVPLPDFVAKIKRERKTEINGQWKKYCDANLGTYQTVRCNLKVANEYPPDEIREALDWWNNPGANEERKLSSYEAHKACADVCEKHRHRLDPPKPATENKPPKPTGNAVIDDLAGKLFKAQEGRRKDATAWKKDRTLVFDLTGENTRLKKQVKELETEVETLKKNTSESTALVIDEADVKRRRALAEMEALQRQADEYGRRAADSIADAVAISEWQLQTNQEFEDFCAWQKREKAKRETLEAAVQAAPTPYFIKKARARQTNHDNQTKIATDMYYARSRQRHEQAGAMRTLGFKRGLPTGAELSARFRVLSKELFTKYGSDTALGYAAEFQPINDAVQILKLPTLEPAQEPEREPVEEWAVELEAAVTRVTAIERPGVATVFEKLELIWRKTPPERREEFRKAANLHEFSRGAKPAGHLAQVLFWCEDDSMSMFGHSIGTVCISDDHLARGLTGPAKQRTRKKKAV